MNIFELEPKTLCRKKGIRDPAQIREKHPIAGSPERKKNIPNRIEETIPNPEQYDRIVLFPPFGMETRAINIPMAQQVLAERFENFPELRLSSADWVFAARAASLLVSGGRAVVAVPLHALNGTQSQSYREFLVRNQLVESVIAIPRGFLNGGTVGFAIVVMREGCGEIKFVNGEEYLSTVDGARLLDVPRLLKDYHD